MSNTVKLDEIDLSTSVPITEALPSHQRIPPYKFLDAWRGLAAIWVALFHAAEVMILGFHANRHDLIYLIASQGQLGVQLFFVISGYCIVNAADGIIRKKQGIREYITARCRRIFPTYWAALIITALLSVGAQWFVGAGIFHSSVLGSSDVMAQSPLWYFSNITLTSLAFGHSLMVMQAWTLCYELAFYLILGIFLGIAIWRGASKILCYGAHLLTIICLIGLYFIPSRIPYPIDLWAQFGYGVLLYHLIKDKKDKFLMMVSVLIITLTVLIAVRHNTPIGHVGQTIRSQFSFAMLFGILLFIAHPFDDILTKSRILRLFAKVGIFSYSLYLTHTFSIGIVSQAIKLLNLPFSMDLLYYLFMIVGALVFGYGFYKIFEEPFLASNSVINSSTTK